MESHSARIERAIKDALANGPSLKVTFSPHETNIRHFLVMHRNGHIKMSPEVATRIESVYRAANWGHTSRRVVVETTELFQPAAFAEQVGHAILSVEAVS